MFQSKRFSQHFSWRSSRSLAVLRRVPRTAQLDDYDGVFQRLRLRPGTHEIVLYFDGYRTVRQNVYLNPGSEQKIAYALERLPPGVTSELPPQPVEPVDADDRPAPGVTVEPRDPAREPEPRQSTSRFGTLSIRVQPGDAEVVVDGDRWDTPEGQQRISIQLSEGRHEVAIRRAGFATYAEIVLVRGGETVTLNVSLSGTRQ